MRFLLCFGLRFGLRFGLVCVFTCIFGLCFAIFLYFRPLFCVLSAFWAQKGKTQVIYLRFGHLHSIHWTQGASPPTPPPNPLQALGPKSPGIPTLTTYLPLTGHIYGTFGPGNRLSVRF